MHIMQAASSSNITSVFNTKTLTLAEMRILTNQPSGTFSASNTVLESRIDGVITMQNGIATGTFGTLGGVTVLEFLHMMLVEL